MYGHTKIPRATLDYDGDFPSPFPSTVPLPPNLLIPPLQTAVATEFDSVHSSSTSSYNSPSSLASCCNTTLKPNLIQRSVSSHSLQKNGLFHCQFAEFVDSETGPVRRVLSTGDLQRINMMQHSSRSCSPLSNESNIIIEAMSKACRYSPEEKKERIERYRSKRNQRNFNKKIKYACRKTLADSRPRIRGRFARNEEIENNSQVQWSQTSGEEDENDDDNWINFLDSLPPNLIP